MGPADSDSLPRGESYSGTAREHRSCRIRDCHPLWSDFPDGSARSGRFPLIKESAALQPRRDESRRFGLVPVRSPLLRESLLLSLPGGTEMFQFPPFATHTYGFSVRQFGHPGINARLTAPPGLSQSSTPFIASWRLDIPHTPLVAWPHSSHPPAGQPARVQDPLNQLPSPPQGVGE
jgi:hypothetical protein